jgi:hypothetical protein
MMEQIIIRIKDKNKARTLYELLRLLDFVESVNAGESETSNMENDSEIGDFFSLAGIWENREISQESLRQKAWPNHS